jgi:AcrR family transcriptional regulator
MEPTKIEQDILAAAQKLFLEKGFAGTSTTDIANEVGCNQALIHYYYRTKDNLFEKVFLQEINDTLKMISKVLDAPLQNVSLTELVNIVIDYYFATLKQRPNLPFFIVQELLLNPGRREMIREQFIRNEYRQEAYNKYAAIIRRMTAAGEIRQIEPFALLINTVSLVAGTFLSLPLYGDLLEKSGEEQETYLDSRKEEIKRVLISRLQP